jgi:hypothetical protein
MLFGYARVSKGEDQSTAAQRRLLREAGADKVYEEAASGGRWDRPELTARQRADITENVLSGRRTAAPMARLYRVSAPTISRILAVHRAFAPEPTPAL